MKFPIVLLCSVAAFCAGMYCSLAADDSDLPSLRLACNILAVDSILEDVSDSNEPVWREYWRMRMGFELENPSFWNIAWCDDDKARVTVQDSAGSRPSLLSFSYLENRKDKRKGSGSSDTEKGWLPATGSQWVRMKGTVPFAVSREDALTEPVTLKLVEGFSAPVVLKEGGLAGKDGKCGDMEVTLKVMRCREGDQKGKQFVEVHIYARHPLGVREGELMGMDGKPLMIDRQWSGIGTGADSWDWYQNWQMDRVPDGEIKVRLRYAHRPQLVTASVDSKLALSGLMAGNEQVKLHPASDKAVEQDKTPSAEAGKTPVTVKLTGLSVVDGLQGDNNWKPSKRISFSLRVEVDKAVGFARREDLEEQKLEVTDSTGGVLTPAVFDLSWMSRSEGVDCVYDEIEGDSPGLSAPGAEWVRLKGTLRVPVARVKESAVYELPLKKDSELLTPVPGMEDPVDGSDVATAGDPPTCRLLLEKVERRDDGDLVVKLNLTMKKMPFDFEDFELVDGKGAHLEASERGGGSSPGGDSPEWYKEFGISKEEDMDKLRFKIRYKADVETVSVPVDVKVGLSGPVSQKKAAAKKGGKGR